MKETSVKEQNTAQGLYAKHLVKSYGKRLVLRDISFHVQKGEAIALLGPNGAGKTTSFYMVAGLVRPDKGNVFLNNQDITNFPMYKRARMGIGYLPQEISIFRGMSVEENILAILEIHIKNKEERNNRLEELLKDLSLLHLKKSAALSLSGGERRRTEVARALASNPIFILLDEPFAGVDPIAVNELREVIALLKQKGIGVLITDHNVRETLSSVDRAYIVYDGTILAQGAPSDIIEHPTVKQVYLGNSFENLESNEKTRKKP